MNHVSFGSGDRIEVLLPLPFTHGFDYAVGDADVVSPGDYVRVPFGKKEVIGVVWGKAKGDAPPEKIKPVLSHLSHLHPMSDSMRAFISWMADYTVTPSGMVLKMVLTPASALEPPVNAPHYILGDRLAKLTASRQKVVDLLSDAVPRPPRRIAQEAGVGAAIVRGMIRQQALREILLPLPLAGEGRGEGGAAIHEAHITQHPHLSPDQREAERQLGASLHNGFGVSVLDGVTGSGKTEVYFDTIERILEKGKQALVLLPEIALSVQWLQRFEKRFGFAPHLWHSEVTESRKTRAWRAAAAGDARVIVGARSALFLPCATLGLIIVDEEHEPSYKQEDGVMYHARDMAIARARHEQIPVILVSATPSLETEENIREGKYARVHLPERHGEAVMPAISLIDMRLQKMDANHFISPDLRRALADTLGRGHQAMLFLNRRGYAPLTLCRSCGYRFQCPHCSAWMVMHKKKIAGSQLSVGSEGARSVDHASVAPEARQSIKGQPLAGQPAEPRSMEFAGANSGSTQKTSLRCHHCGYGTKVRALCPSCGGEDTLHPCGPGVERIAQEVGAYFPQARLALLSTDEIQTMAQLQQAIEAIASRQVDIVVGTQMMAKGHHFPSLALVGVIDADMGLQGGDLRAGERTYQLLHQLSGRAGRAAIAGHVYIQSFMPEHKVMQALAAGDRDGFIELELAQRRESGLPPFGRLAALILEGANEQEVARHARELASQGLGMLGGNASIKILGPAPAPLTLLRGKYRYRLLVKTARKVKVQSFIKDWVAHYPLPRNLRLKIDIDPQSFV